MCNLNIIYNRKGKVNEKISMIMNIISYASWMYNDQGEGYIALDKKKLHMQRQKNKIIYKGNYYFMASHQRLATSGYSESNIHPQPTQNLILMHNGIFSGLGDKDEGDTAIYLKLLDAEYINSGEDIIEAIRKTNKQMYGSYSILVFERKTRKIYYYKESSTKMYALVNDEWIVMSTRKENVEYVKEYMKIKGEITEPKALKIYDVLEGMKIVGGFTEKTFTHTQTSIVDLDKEGNFKIYPKGNTWDWRYNND